jgi:uncharacterized membrane protein
MTTALSTPNSIKTHGLAIASLVLAFTGFTILPWLGCIFAIVTGNIAKKEIHAHPEIYTGENLANAGVTLGWIGTIGIIVLALLAVLMLAPIRTVGPVMTP